MTEQNIITFDDLLTAYINQNNYADRVYDNKGENKAFKVANLNWFKYMKLLIDFVPECTDPLPMDKEIYRITDGLPVKIMTYRSKDTPIYLDDYGQQYYTFINGEEFTGGAYTSLTVFLRMCSDFYDEQLLIGD